MNTPWFLGNSREFAQGWGVSIALLALWSIVWTGLALWHAARRGEKWWFVLFFVVHTAGILEIIYLFFVARAFASRTSRKRRS
jgi:hypothetical protein